MEDDASYGLMIQTWLKKNGYEAVLATRYEQAKAEISSGGFGLILTDLRLPDGDGILLMTWVREKMKSKVPIIVMTGYAEVQTAVSAMKLGAFDYLKKKVNIMLRKDGYPPLPKDYWFKLTPIETEEQMRINILYVARNPYEKQFSVPGGYPWGSAWLHHSPLGKMVKGTRADAVSKRELERLCGTRTPIPPHWEFHPRLGLLPLSFVNEKLFYKLFPSPKKYETRLIKEYEAFVKLGKDLNEDVEFSREEILDILSQVLRDSFSGKRFKDLSGEESGRLCQQLNERFCLSAEQIASAIGIQEYVVRQLLNSKEFGKRHIF